MSEKKRGRRRFLRSAATLGIGVAGGIAATGTAAANSDEIRVYSNSNYWEYQVHTTTGYDDLKRGSEAEQHDTFPGSGDDFVAGEVSDGGVDNFWMDSGDSITQINVTYNDYGWIKISEETANMKTAVKVDRDENPDWPGYNYTIDISGQVQPHDEYFDYGQDEIRNGDAGPFVGTIDPGDVDAVWKTGVPTRVFIEDPNSPGLGLTITLPS
ncbi:hypothetical protein [Haladaptatus salinisoli]|uniref:hypothetical protein n=1 Tax=Haladaptatus salinisoli TaxID=2884876 RepID=UPI001D0A9797|nr:hypothetical protein [Haladaptatus salinisoli]